MRVTGDLLSQFLVAADVLFPVLGDRRGETGIAPEKQ
jgi:hypothetical protein